MKVNRPVRYRSNNIRQLFLRLFQFKQQIVTSIDKRRALYKRENEIALFAKLRITQVSEAPRRGISYLSRLVVEELLEKFAASFAN